MPASRCLFRHKGPNLLATDAARALADVAHEVLRKMREGVRTTRDIAGYAADRIGIGSLAGGTVPTIMGPKLRNPNLQTVVCRHRSGLTSLLAWSRPLRSSIAATS
jgi:LysR family malonate utilization transcriptional regulator